MMCKESKNTYLKKKYKELYVIFDGTQTVSLMKNEKNTYLNAKIGFKYVNRYEVSLFLGNQISRNFSIVSIVSLTFFLSNFISCFVFRLSKFTQLF